MTSRRSSSFVLLMVLASSLAYSGCLDLTIPPQKGLDASTDLASAGGQPAVDVPPATGGAGGQTSSGGQSGSGGAAGATGTGEAADASPPVTGGTTATGGGGGTSTGGTGPGPDAGTDPRASGGSVGGTGGGATGGAGGGAGTDAVTIIADARPEDGNPQLADLAPDATPDIVADVAIDAAADAPPSPLFNGLVAYYPCDHVDGTSLRDRSGKGNHGTLTSTSGSYKIEAGKVGNAVTLVQSSGGYVSLPPAIFRGAAEITIAAWVRLTTLTLWQRLFDVGINANLAQNTATGTVYLTFFLKDFSNKLGVSSTKDGYGAAQQVTADAFATGVWKHIAVVMSGGGATIYLDGVAVAMVNPVSPPQALGNLDYAYIGKSQFSADPFIDAQIDEFRVYGRALSASEIQLLFAYAGP